MNRIRAELLAAAQGLVLALWSITASLMLFILTTVSISLIPAGVGLVTTPMVVRLTRAHADARRRVAGCWFGVEIRRPYAPRPKLAGGLADTLRLLSWVLGDPATWRDYLWLIVDVNAGFTLALLPFAMLAEGLFGWVIAAGLWHVLARVGYWYEFVPITGPVSIVPAAALGTVWLFLAVRYGPTIMMGHVRMTRAFLGPTADAELRQRVARLTETRSDAVDTSAAELRRIERDLHDGAQARLVAVGLSLGAIERLLEHDPEQAKLLISEARESSSKALSELRDLVRGIHPPVLAERGLGDAVRALAMASPLVTEVEAEMPGRPPAPVESAVYFAVSEVLTNAAKHSGARRVWIDLQHRDGMLRVSVTDDGHGGADDARGTGLRGIERRLATFDGVLAVSSPLGGPTIVTMELPCALSPA